MKFTFKVSNHRIDTIFRRFTHHHCHHRCPSSASVLTLIADSPELERAFLTQIAVGLATRVYFEFLCEKQRQKHKYAQLATSLLQPIACLCSDEVAAFNARALPTDQDKATLRRAPLFLAPIISRIAAHLRPFVAEIAAVLLASMDTCARAQPKTIKTCAKAVHALH
jgi:hypothetical protein